MISRRFMIGWAKITAPMRTVIPSGRFLFMGLHAYADLQLWLLLEAKLKDLQATGATSLCSRDPVFLERASHLRLVGQRPPPVPQLGRYTPVAN